MSAAASAFLRNRLNGSCLRSGGRTWTIPKIVTGYLQQTGNLVRLEDGTVVLPFGHKNGPGAGKEDGVTGQRAIQGRRWGSWRGSGAASARGSAGQPTGQQAGQEAS